VCVNVLTSGLRGKHYFRGVPGLVNLGSDASWVCPRICVLQPRLLLSYCNADTKNTRFLCLGIDCIPTGVQEASRDKRAELLNDLIGNVRWAMSRSDTVVRHASAHLWESNTLWICIIPCEIVWFYNSLTIGKCRGSESWPDNVRSGDGKVLGVFLALHTNIVPDRYRYDGQYFMWNSNPSFQSISHSRVQIRLNNIIVRMVDSQRDSGIKTFNYCLMVCLLPIKIFTWKQADPLALHLHTVNMLLKILSVLVLVCIILSESAVAATCTSGQMDNWYAQPSRIPNDKWLTWPH